MFTLYNVVKFLHVTAAIVWVGGVVATAVMSGRMAREPEHAAIGLMARQSEFLGRAVIGPAAGLTLLTGLGLAWIMGGLTFWMAWGLVGVFASIALGATLLRRANLDMEKLLGAGVPDAERLSAIRRRLTVAGTLNIALLLSVVWVMVSKPTL